MGRAAVVTALGGRIAGIPGLAPFPDPRSPSPLHAHEDADA